VLERYRMGFDNPEISKNFMINRLKHLIKFVMEDTSYFNNLYWIMPALKQFFIDGMERNGVLDLSEKILVYFSDNKDYQILPHLKSLFNDFEEYATWLLNKIIEEDSSLSVKTHLIRPLWDMGANMQRKITAVVKEILGGKWINMK